MTPTDAFPMRTGSIGYIIMQLQFLQVGWHSFPSSTKLSTDSTMTSLHNRDFSVNQIIT